MYTHNKTKTNWSRDYGIAWNPATQRSLIEKYPLSECTTFVQCFYLFFYSTFIHFHSLSFHCQWVQPVEPRYNMYNEPLHNKVLATTNDFLWPSNSKICEKKPLDTTKPRNMAPWPFVISRFHCITKIMQKTKPSYRSAWFTSSKK